MSTKTKEPDERYPSHVPTAAEMAKLTLARPLVDDGTRFWRIVEDRFHMEVFGQEPPSLAVAAMYFTAAAELFKLGYGVDHSRHPRNPFFRPVKRPERLPMPDKHEVLEVYEFEASGSGAYLIPCSLRVIEHIDGVYTLVSPTSVTT